MNYRMWHFRGEYIFENTIVRMQFAICDDEKSIGLILEEKIKKLLPDAVIETYLSGDELIASGCKPDMLFLDNIKTNFIGYKKQRAMLFRHCPFFYSKTGGMRLWKS